MFLFINNLSGNSVFLALLRKDGRNLVEVRLSNRKSRSENILAGIDGLLAKSGKSLTLIKGIIVVRGPGSFVGIRVALSVANTLSWLLKIPIAGVTWRPADDKKTLINRGLAKLSGNGRNKPIRPFYDKAPNITLKRNK